MSSAAMPPQASAPVSAEQLESTATRMFRYRAWRIQQALIRLNHRLTVGDLPRNQLQYDRWKVALTHEFRETRLCLGEIVLARRGKAVKLPQIIEALIEQTTFGADWDLDIHALASVPITHPLPPPPNDILSTEDHLGSMWWEWDDRDPSKPAWWQSPTGEYAVADRFDVDALSKAEELSRDLEIITRRMLAMRQADKLGILRVLDAVKDAAPAAAAAQSSDS